MAVFRWRPAASRHCVDEGGCRSIHSFACPQWWDTRRLGVGALRGLSEVYLAPGPGQVMLPASPLDLVVLSLEGPVTCRLESLPEPLAIDAGAALCLPARAGQSVRLANPSWRIVRFLTLRLMRALGGHHVLPAVVRCEAAQHAGTFTTLTDLNSPMVALHRAEIGPECTVSHPLQATRQYYLQVLSGEVLVNRQPMSTGDGVHLHGQGRVVAKNLSWIYPADVLLVDLAIDAEAAGAGQSLAARRVRQAICSA